MQEPDEKIFSARKFAGFCLFCLGLLAACDPLPTRESQLPEPRAQSSCGDRGSLSATLIGSIATDLDWSHSEFECESMRRPDSDGIRLRFSGDVADERLAIIIAIPGLNPDQNGVELPSNVTATVEGSGRFFSTPDLDSCWTDIRSQERSVNVDGQYLVSGTLNCVAPLGELNGGSAILIPELSFTSIVNWSTP